MSCIVMLFTALLSVLVLAFAVFDNGNSTNKGLCKDYARPNPLCVYCADETSIQIDSELERNLTRLFEEMATKISPTGFVEVFNFSVHGRAMCRGDVESRVCEKCIKDAGREILKECKRPEAILWNEKCQIQYSFTKFGRESPSGKHPSKNSKEKDVSTDLQLFRRTWSCLMNNLASKAASNSRRFATGEAPFNGKKIYGLAQCLPGKEIDCRSCFTQLLDELDSCCSSREGGAILDQSCNVRFHLDNTPFYQSQSSKEKCPSGTDSKALIIALAAGFPSLVVVSLITVAAVYHRRNKGREGHGGLDTSNLLFMDLQAIREATDNFSDEKKLGRGGFGAVYKGALPNGKEVAVKRLSRKSWQGFEEFKNEIDVIAKLQHRNLVRLLGWGMEAEEQILIYELMSNGSLDTYIFDSEMRRKLEWKVCSDLIKGIARGLLYLHEDSLLKIIHRDLKPSNVLLDGDMVAKLSDFGMARIFGGERTTYVTKKPVGTFGYMAPEYAMLGIFSIKSDVFSFGVLVLEIISGQKNSTAQPSEEASSLLAYAWRLWKDGKESELVEPMLRESCSMSEVKKCIHISLLCVQEDPDDRPTMSLVVAELERESSVTLAEPKQPVVPRRLRLVIDQASSSASINMMTSSNLLPR